MSSLACGATEAQREVEALVQGHRVRNWQKWELNTDLWDSTVHDLSASPEKGLETHKETG